MVCEGEPVASGVFVRPPVVFLCREVQTVCTKLPDMAGKSACTCSIGELVCTSICLNQSSGLLQRKKTDGALTEAGGERCIAFLQGGEEHGYPCCVNTPSVVLIKCYYSIS